MEMIKTPIETPLCKLRLQAIIGFMDEKGTLRNFDENTANDVHSMASGAYEAVFNVNDYAYSGHFGLTGEYCLRIELGALIGAPGGLRRFDVVVVCFSQKEVSELVVSAKRAKETPVTITHPGFMNIAKEGRSENAQVTIEAVAKANRAVLIRAVRISVPIDDAEYIVDQIALYKEQMSANC
jgi:hypothetical protein